MKYLFLLMFSSNIFADQCLTTNYTYVYGSKKVQDKIELCEIKKEKISYFVSKNCEDLKCIPSKKLKLKDQNFQVGSLGFKLCHQYLGIPQILSFTDQKNKTQEIERCIFSSKTFVEIGLLVDVDKELTQK